MENARKEKARKGILLSVLLVCGNCLQLWGVSGYTLDNYLIPVDKPGATVGKFCPLPSDIRLVSDTSSLFRIDVKSKSVCLKKGKALSQGQSAYRYGITLQIDGRICEFELLKDGFSRNRIVAHRGAWKKSGVLQNSIRSFRNAVALGCQGSELDVWLTADDRVVLSHDPRVYGMEVENTSLAELFQKTAHEDDPVPSLQELLLVARSQNTTHPVIEIKESQK